MQEIFNLDFMNIALIIVAFFGTALGATLVTEAVKLINAFGGNVKYIISWLVAIVASLVLMFSTGELDIESFAVAELATTISAVGLVSQGIYEKFFKSE